MNSLKDNLIAKKYSSALAEISLELRTLEDLELVNQVFYNSKDLVSVLSSPSVDLELKKNILVKVFSQSIQKSVLNLLLLLLSKRRINLISLLEANYKNIYYQQKNIGLAQIQSANEFTNEDLAEIRRELEKAFKQDIQITSSINPDLLSGMKINISGKVIDSSLKTKLKKFKSLLGA